MKKINIFLIAVLSLGLSSCENWLDIQPADTTVEEDLFKVGTGYRIALNGVYRQLSSTALYGQELTWGMADVLGQVYNTSRLSSHAYTALGNFNYSDTQKAKDLISAVWSTAYNVIANCNNIIGRIESEPAVKFVGGQLERDMILGEALAVRALMHFEMLCYFAPAPAAEHAGYWIPYYENFPSTSADYQSVEKILELVIRDLKRGQELTLAFDTHQYGDEPNVKDHTLWLTHLRRFRSEADNSSYPEDIFYAFRGYRMNSQAITAILARVYGYAGEHTLAAAEAQKVIDISSVGYPIFDFTPKTDVVSDYKMTGDLIFTLSNPTLLDDYKSFVASKDIGDTKWTMSSKYYSPGIFDSEGDCRKTTLLRQSGRTFFPKRYTKPDQQGQFTEIGADMLPVIRLAEMYYLQAEDFAAKNDFVNAIDKLEDVRMVRGCDPGKLTTIIDKGSFVKELLLEVQREFAEEGRTFFYHKKYNSKFSASMKDEAFYLPLPDNETIH
ncbi:RagB/SusD family nutrient uptake outer membrane protein [Alistipes sp.]|uniref:RagB/SusD family nutrient uptake outer membrane protein n=1 Tax=Alistipes sp. TaxID=1872444 RepID=UPI003AEF815E